MHVFIKCKPEVGVPVFEVTMIAGDDITEVVIIDVTTCEITVVADTTQGIAGTVVVNPT